MDRNTILPTKSYTDHGRKDIIRKLWCKPQIQLLNLHLHKKLAYIGLPDIQALDVIEWLDYLDKVIAFQCSNYNGIEIDVSKLDDLLEDLERQNKIRSGFVYQGYMEDIVMGGLSERGQTYSQSDFLKIYNLDFCNNLITPRTIINERGKKIHYYKTEVIDKFMEWQELAGNSGKGEKFIMYITVNSNSFEMDLSTIKDKCIKEYLKEINKIRKPEVRAARELKAYCFFELSNVFKKHNFNIEFLPPIFYLGSSYPNKEPGPLKQHRMITFTILGTKRVGDEEFFKQNCQEFLNKKFIFATDTAISCYEDKYVGAETTYDSDVLEIIKNSYTYKNYWQ